MDVKPILTSNENSAICINVDHSSFLIFLSHKCLVMKELYILHVFTVLNTRSFSVLLFSSFPFYAYNYNSKIIVI